MAAQSVGFEHVSGATRTLQKRRQVYEVQDALDAQKLKYAAESERFAKAEAQLRARDAQLQLQLIKFNKFLQDNEAKRRRAETRAAEEAVLIHQRDQEISELQDQLEAARSRRTQLDRDVSQNAVYGTYLEGVKEVCEDVAEVSEIVTWHSTLAAAHADLVQTLRGLEAHGEQLKGEFQEYKKSQALHQLNSTNHASMLQQKLDALQKRRKQLDSHCHEQRERMSVRSVFIGRQLQSIDNLFRRCVKEVPHIQHLHCAKKSPEEEEEAEDAAEEASELEQSVQGALLQLKPVHAYMVDIKEIVATLQKERRGQARAHALGVEHAEDVVEFVSQMPDGGTAN